MRGWLEMMVALVPDGQSTPDASIDAGLGLLPVDSFDAFLEPPPARFDSAPPFVALSLRGVGADPAALRASVIAWLDARSQLRQLDCAAHAQSTHRRRLQQAVAALVAARDAVRRQLAPCSTSLQKEVLKLAEAHWTEDRTRTVQQKCAKNGYLHPNARAGCCGSQGNAAEHLRLLLLNHHDTLNLPETRAGATLNEAQNSERGFDGQALWHPGIAMGARTLAALHLHGNHLGAVNAAAGTPASKRTSSAARFCPLTAVDALLGDGAPSDLPGAVARKVFVVAPEEGASAVRAPRFLLVKLDTLAERRQVVAVADDSPAVLQAKQWAASASPILQRGRVRLTPGGAYHSYTPIAALLGDSHHWTAMIRDPQDRRWRAYDDLKKSGGGHAGASAVRRRPHAVRPRSTKWKAQAQEARRSQSERHLTLPESAGTGTLVDTDASTEGPAGINISNTIAKDGSVFVYRLDDQQ